MRHDAWVGALSWWSCQSPVPCICRLLNHLSRFCRGMLKLNAKFVTDLLLYLLSHFECNGHTVHILTQGCLLPPLTTTVKSSLFTHVHSSPLSLAVRLHWCRQIILVILTMAGLFPDRPHHICIFGRWRPGLCAPFPIFEWMTGEEVRKVDCKRLWVPD